MGTEGGAAQGSAAGRVGPAGHAALDDGLRARLAAAARAEGPPRDGLVADLVAAVGDVDALAGEPAADVPYSRRVLHASPDLEVMVARWHPHTGCAPHDHGGSSGFVVAVDGTFDELRHTWRGAELTVTDRLGHATGAAFSFGPDVVHSMTAGETGLSLHVYAPAPARMAVFDLDRAEVLDLAGDFGAWVPDGDHPRTPFAEATTDRTDAEAPTDDRPEVVWVAHTTRYRGGSAEFATAAETMRRERAAAQPDAEVQLVALDGKADLAAEMARLAAEGRRIRELHLIGHAGMYGPMFGSVEWPEQLSPHEWRQLHIPFAEGGRAWFHACRTARWFAPFFARTFDVPTFGNHGYTTVSASRDRFRWAGRRPEDRDELYLVATPGRRSHGLLGSVRKYAGAPVEAMIESVPAPPDGITSYDKVAELYDRAYVDITVREAEWAWIIGHVATARAAVGGPLRLLEVGCGNGALLRQLDERGDLASGIGLDDSATMVERARARSGDHDNLRFDRIDGPVIDAPDASVDVVLSFLSFRYLDWDPLMDEIRRVLRPGGRLWVVDMVAQPVRVRELPVLARSTLTHLRRPTRHPAFAADLEALTSHPDWKAMVRHNPIRAEHEYRWYLESRFPGPKLEVLTVSPTQRVVAFDSGPLAAGRTEPLSYP